VIATRCKRRGFSLLLAANREGAFLAAAMRCAWAASSPLLNQGVPVELHVLFAGCDRQMRLAAWQVCRELGMPCQLHRVRQAGLIQAWRFGMQRAKGEWLALLCEDDLMAVNWLSAVHSAILAHDGTPSVVFHPRMQCTFELRQQLRLLPDQSELEDPRAALISANCWPGSCVLSRKLLDHLPLRRELDSSPSQLPKGLWAWHLESLQHGVVHQAVPGTCEFRRDPANWR